MVLSTKYCYLKSNLTLRLFLTVRAFEFRALLELSTSHDQKIQMVPRAVESTLNLIKKVELATQGQAPSASKALVMKANNVLFEISDTDGHQPEGKSVKMWTRGNVDGRT